MKIIDRYLSRSVCYSMLMVLLLLSGLTVFISLVKEVGDIGSADYGFWGAVLYVLLGLPQQIYNLFPVSALLGVLLGLSWLSTHHELTILRAGGMSIGQIGWSVLKGALGLLLIATLIGELVAPSAEHMAESEKTLLTSGGQALKTLQGIWIRDGHNFIYIRTVIGSRHLQGVTQYEFDDQQNLIRASYAQTGWYTRNKWVMKNVVESFISPQNVRTQQIDQIVWPLSISPSLLRISEIDPDEMSLHQLYDYINYLKINHLDERSYTLVFWQRILQPLATVVMIWLAIPFIFGPLRSTQASLRLILGSLLGFSFYILNEFLGPLSIVYEIPSFLAAVLPIAIFMLIAYSLQIKAR